MSNIEIRIIFLSLKLVANEALHDDSTTSHPVTKLFSKMRLSNKPFSANIFMHVVKTLIETMFLKLGKCY